MSKPRIAGGIARGRALEIPKQGTRPSPSRLREALFNKLEFLERGRFLDLFSGSGAIALEAASRGWDATGVDLSKDAAAVMRRNAKTLELPLTVIQADALKYVKKPQDSFDIVFAAPPYPLDLPPLFQSIFESDLLKPNGLFIFQHPSQLKLELKHEKTFALDARRYGSNVISYFSFTD